MTRLISLEEAAGRIGISRRTVDRYIARGQFVALYQLPSGHLRCDEFDLKEWLQSKRNEPNLKEPSE